MCSVQEGVLSRPAFMFCTLVAQTRHAAILVVPSSITNAACAFTSTVERRPCQLQLQLHKCPCPTSGILNSRSFPNATLNAKNIIKYQEKPGKTVNSVFFHCGRSRSWITSGSRIGTCDAAKSRILCSTSSSRAASEFSVVSPSTRECGGMAFVMKTDCG